LINSAGIQVVSYTYSTWGEVLSITGSLASTVGQQNPYRYRGYRYDSETQLYYLQSRYYNPQWGRFVNADDTDTIGATEGLLTTNLFTYCVNNPVNMTDESGYWPYAIDGVGSLGVGAGISWGVIGTSILTGLGAITPAGWVMIGTSIVVISGVIVINVVGVKDDYLWKISNQVHLVTKRTAKRIMSRSRKEAYEKAKRAGKNKEPIHHPNDLNRPHYHPDVSNRYSKTPNQPNKHDHYYYPKRR
jgi:RHS repeat-associated protein